MTKFKDFVRSLLLAVTDNTLVPVDRIVPDRQEVYRNFLCTVRDDWGEFK